MLKLTDRAFKVRSGKVLKNLKSINVDLIRSLYALQESIDECVEKYFDACQQQKFKDAYPEYSDIVVELATKVVKKDHKVREYSVPDVKVKPKPHKPTPSKLKIAKAEPPKVVPKAALLSTDKVDIVFSFDDTGSMAACRSITRKLVDELSAELLVEFGDKLNVGVVIHGDYCDPCDPVVILPMTKDWVSIKKFLNADRRFGGGDAPECYELVLKKVQDLEWRVKSRKVLVLIGDEVPHGPNYRHNINKIDWRYETTALGNSGVQIISVQALNNKHADSFYATLASETGGHHLRLTQLSQTAELLRAICYDSCGKLSQYESYKHAETNSPAFRRNIDILAGRVTTPTTVDGLSEFQMFAIDTEDHDMRIMDYVRKLGLKYTPGCGYYEFTKQELVQDYKKVVVQDRSTEVFYPDAEGRTLLKLPPDGSVKINPKNYPDKYRFFIQSTSYTRKLKADTTFLYDMSVS